jgi:hypothetical protein
MMFEQNQSQWTSELTDTFVPGEDQLGVEGAAQGYQQWLIPGIITTTDRARYYSFYAWVLHRFINSPGSSRLLKDFRGPFYKRHEMVLILGVFSHHKDREIVGGLVGSGINNFKVRTWWEAGDPVSLDTHYFQNSLGGFGQYYLTAMQAMGIVGANEHPAWVYQLTSRGESLAKAYQESIAQTTYAQNLGHAGELTSLSHSDALDYGVKGCLCPEALAESRDLPLLREAFFRFDQQGQDNPHTRRRLALAVTLDLVRGASGQFKREMLRPALYLGEYKPKLMVQSTPQIQTWVSRWKLVEIRHLYTFGLQCLWAAFLLHLRGQQNGIAIPEYDEWLRQTIGKESFDLPLADYLDELCLDVGLSENWAESQQSFAQACSMVTGKDEFTCYQNASKNPTNAGKLLGYGIRILSQLYLRFHQLHLNNDPIWLEMANRQRLPLGDFFLFVDEVTVQHGVSLGKWLMRVYREMIWGQHEFIALEKLRYQGYDTFKFSYRDGRFYWPFRKTDAYREPIRLAANRLSNALTILNDLGLVNKDQDGAYSLSADGETMLTQSVEAYRHDH